MATHILLMNRWTFSKTPVPLCSTKTQVSCTSVLSRIKRPKSAIEIEFFLLRKVSELHQSEGQRRRVLKGAVRLTVLRNLSQTYIIKAIIHVCIEINKSGQSVRAEKATQLSGLRILVLYEVHIDNYRIRRIETVKDNCKGPGKHFN